MPQTMVREYANPTAFQREAQKLAQQGWTVQSQTERTQGAGCLRFCLIGPLAMIFRPTPHLVVTYTRQ